MNDNKKIKIAMRKTIISLSVLVLITSSCGQATKKQNKEVHNVENVLFAENKENEEAPEIKNELPDYSDFENKQNLLGGKVFKSGKEVSELTNWTHGGGAVIHTGKNENGTFRFSVGRYIDENETLIITFEEFLYDEYGNVNFKVLDIINIGRLKENENLEYCDCRLDKVLDSEIIAVVIWEDKEFHDKIVKAWRANTKTGKIEPIGIEEIDCENEGYGV